MPRSPRRSTITSRANSATWIKCRCTRDFAGEAVSRKVAKMPRNTDNGTNKKIQTIKGTRACQNATLRLTPSSNTSVKKTILYFVASLWCIFYTASTQPVFASENLHERTVRVCVNEQLQAYGRLSDDIRRQMTERIFAYDLHLTTKLPTQFGGITVRYLSSDEIAAEYRKRKKAKTNEKDRAEVPISMLRPMRNEGNTIIVSIGDYWVSYRKNSVNYALEGGCTVYYEFDKGSGEIKIAKTDLWGI